METPMEHYKQQQMIKRPITVDSVLHAKKIPMNDGESWDRYTCAWCAGIFDTPSSKFAQKKRQHENTFACRYGGEIYQWEREGFFCLHEVPYSDRIMRIARAASIEVRLGHARKVDRYGQPRHDAKAFLSASWVPQYVFWVHVSLLGTSPMSNEDLARREYKATKAVQLIKLNADALEEITAAFKLKEHRGVTHWLRQIGFER